MGQGRIPRATPSHKVEKQTKSKRQKKEKSEQKGIPRTVENSRPIDPSTIKADDSQFELSIHHDEFSTFFQSTPAVKPKILITTLRRASKECYMFAHELSGCFFGSCVKTRAGDALLGDVIALAQTENFTDLFIIGQRLKEPYSLTMIHFPRGPTMTFKLFSIKSAKAIRNHGNPTDHPPELIMNHFTSMLGASVGRYLMTLFPKLPDFKGRQVVTFHHQRDFIFFRRHRYQFELDTDAASSAQGQIDAELSGDSVDPKATLPTVTDKVKLQELGPRFTLKLQSILKGLPNDPEAPYLWRRVKGMTTRKSAHL